MGNPVGLCDQESLSLLCALRADAEKKLAKPQESEIILRFGLVWGLPNRFGVWFVFFCVDINSKFSLLGFVILLKVVFFSGK